MKLPKHSDLIIFLLIVYGLVAGVSESIAMTFSAQLSSGYRQDELDWNIAGSFSGTGPDILSELQWKDLSSYQVGVGAEMTWPVRRNMEIVLLGDLSYGFIYSGDNQDSDYAGDNRTLEWSRSNNDASDGHLLDLLGGGGVRFKVHDKFSLTPLVGYSYYEQDLVMQDGLQTLSDQSIADNFFPPGEAPLLSSVGTTFPDLDSSYYAWWFGGWLGGEVRYRLNEKVAGDLTLRWHHFDFRAEADWNLRPDLQHPVSFEHEADGNGISMDLGLRYFISKKWDVMTRFRYIDMKADDGLDIVYFSDNTVGGTRLNQVNWESWALSLTARYLF